VRNINSKYIASESGKCIFCLNFEKHREHLENNFQKIEWKFNETISKRKGWKNYDCLVLVSWGKDSIMTLYKLKKDTNLRILAYTFDNWFESPEALENISNTVEKLEIDWMFDKPWFVPRVLKTILLEKIPISICRFCAPIMIHKAIEVAYAYQIPYLITGRNKGQSDKEPSRFPLRNLSQNTFDSLLKNYPFLKNIWIEIWENEKLLKQYNIEIASPWIYEKRDTQAYMKIIENELGWKVPKMSYPRYSTNCILNFLQVVLSRKYFWYSHYDCEESMLIQYHETTKQKAIEILNLDIDYEIIHSILKKLSLTLEDIWLSQDELKQYGTFQGAST